MTEKALKLISSTWNTRTKQVATVAAHIISSIFMPGLVNLTPNLHIKSCNIHLSIQTQKYEAKDMNDDIINLSNFYWAVMRGLLILFIFFCMYVGHVYEKF